MPELPDLDELTSFTQDEVRYDSLVRKSIEEGYMTETELLIGRYVSDYLDLNVPSNDDLDAELEAINAKLPEACEVAAKQFKIPVDTVRELYNKSLEIRARNL